MANLSDLEPHPDHYYRFDIPRRTRGSAWKSFLTVLAGVILALVVLSFIYSVVVTGNQVIK